VLDPAPFGPVDLGRVCDDALAWIEGMR